jgi:hypothetical protein
VDDHQFHYSTKLKKKETLNLESFLYKSQNIFLKAYIKFGAALHIEEIKTCPLIEAFN